MTVPHIAALTRAERACLEVLREYTAPQGENCLPFAPIMEGTGLTHAEVRTAVRRLRDLGLAEYFSALWNDRGPAGAGYCITELGQKQVATDDHLP